MDIMSETIRRRIIWDIQITISIITPPAPTGALGSSGVTPHKVTEDAPPEEEATCPEECSAELPAACRIHSREAINILKAASPAHLTVSEEHLHRDTLFAALPAAHRMAVDHSIAAVLAADVRVQTAARRNPGAERVHAEAVVAAVPIPAAAILTEVDLAGATVAATNSHILDDPLHQCICPALKRIV